VIEQMRSSATVCDLCEEIMSQIEIKYKPDVQALRKRLARLYYENKISKLADPEEKERVFKAFQRFFGGYALSAVEDFQNTSIVRKTYNHLFPPYSARRYKLKNILRPVTRYRN
jgi:N-acetyl-anhydromuramyl-L-alanine amidase AmpD